MEVDSTRETFYFVIDVTSSTRRTVNTGVLTALK